MATHLGLAFDAAGLNIKQVYSRSESSASQLAGQLSCSLVTNLKLLNNDSDLYVLSIPDDAVPEALNEIDTNGKFIVHTSGSLPMQIFNGKVSEFGVFYPLQTFSKNKVVDFEEVPLCLEACSPKLFEMLFDLGQKISKQVQAINSDERKVLHLAAVFACNFPNYLYSLSHEILSKASLDFDLIKPLIMETAGKVKVMNPLEAQTGPALRGDQKIMEEHLSRLTDYPDIQDLYKRISQLIADNGPVKPVKEINKQ